VTEFKTVQIALYGALAGAVIGTGGLYLHPGGNDTSLVWIWIGMAATCAGMAAACAGALSGIWNIVARRSAA
jgi:hypothetical protein